MSAPVTVAEQHRPQAPTAVMSRPRDRRSPSVLFEDDTPTPTAVEQPDFFVDLGLDQIVAALVTARGDYQLEPIYHSPLHSVDEIRFRQLVTRDVQRPAVRAVLDAYAQAHRDVRRYLQQGNELRHPRQKQRWHLDAARRYVTATEQLDHDLQVVDPDSPGLTRFAAYLHDALTAEDFASLRRDVTAVGTLLGRVEYCLTIAGNRITVTPYDGQLDYTDQVERTFARFRQASVTDYRVGFTPYADMDHVEGGVLDLVAQQFPEAFDALTAFTRRWATFIDPVIARFDREIQFYLAYVEYIDSLDPATSFCYPDIGDHKDIRVERTFDLALARALHTDRSAALPVVNDLELSDPERILVISGPNQGGKTTMSRVFGQLHYLAALGLPVPGHRARLLLFDRIFTHYERQESVDTLRGKLEDDLHRIHDILARATGRSIIILNELFTSTTLEDAIFLGTQVLHRIIELDALAVYVTFIDEFSRIGPQTVSMVSTVEPGHPERRTFKVVRRAADGNAYAMAIADKYRLTYRQLADRLSPRAAS